MLYVMAQNFVEAENKEAYLKLAKEMVDETRKEDGCHEFTLTTSQADPTEFIFFEIWESRAHLEVHMKCEHFVRLGPQMGQYSKPGKVWIMNDVFEA